MARNAVLGTAELLVSILQELDVKTLLLARRVSKQWLTAIQSSPELQEKLFYTHRQKNGAEERYLWTPLYRELEPCGSDYLPDKFTPLTYESLRILTPTSINPLLTKEILPLDVDVFNTLTDQGQRIQCFPISELLKHPQGSWQSMFLSQPPTTKVFTKTVIRMRANPGVCDGRSEPLPHFCWIEDPTGVKMSQVVEKVLSIAHKLGLGAEDLQDARLDNWRITFAHCVDLSLDPVRVPPNPGRGDQISSEALLMARTRT